MNRKVLALLILVILGWSFSPGEFSRMTSAQETIVVSFDADNYHLGNMGMVASFPKEMPLAESLRRLDEILNRLEPEQEQRRYPTEADLPAPKPAPVGQIELVEYPDKNEQQPAGLIFAWPAQLKLVEPERTLLDLFLSSSISGESRARTRVSIESIRAIIGSR
jgi:hypothetical protein